MLKQQMPRIANMGLRALATGSKFLLLFGLAKLLQPSEVGEYGLFAATIGFSMLIIGGDYYTYSQRELLSLPKKEWSFVLQHQLIATGLIYLVFLPIQGLWFTFGMLPSSLLQWFFSLLVAEHIAQEINRLLVAMHRPLMASWVLFLRMGLWVWVLLPIMWLYPQTQNLSTVYTAWLVGVLMAIVTGLLVIYRDISPLKWWPTDMAWIIKGFRTAALFLTATMCFKALLTADRYIVEYLAGSELLGVYVLYIGIAMAVTSFMDSAVFSFLYPKLVRAYRQNASKDYQKVMKELQWSVIGFGTLLGFGVIILAPVVLGWLGRPLYLEHTPMLWLLLLMALIYNIAMIPHYGLYAKGDDRGIVIAHVSSLAVFALGTIITAPLAPLLAAPVGLICAFSWMGSYKHWRYRHLADTPNNTAIHA